MYVVPPRLWDLDELLSVVGVVAQLIELLGDLIEIKYEIGAPRGQGRLGHEPISSRFRVLHDDRGACCFAGRQALGAVPAGTGEHNEQRPIAERLRGGRKEVFG